MERTDKKKWIRSTLAHEECSRVPYHFLFTPPALAKLKAYYHTEDVARALDFPIFLHGCNDKPLYADPAVYGDTITDPYGVVWTTNAIDRGVPIGPSIREPSMQGVRFPDPEDPKRYEGVQEAFVSHGECFLMASIGDLWERVTFLRGMEAALYDVALNRAFLEALLERIMEYDLATMHNLARYGVDAIFLSDDYGTQKDLVMSPADWRHFVRPRLKRIFEEARSLGLVTLLHSCGNVRKIVPDLIEIGLDVLHPIQPEAMDIFELKRTFGADLTFQGGISTQDLLPYGSPDAVSEAVTRTLGFMARSGGYILESGISIQADVPLENMLAMFECVGAG
ncbi:MAG: uroporphyrinogen decarboxylase family protein [Candidatus Latescibacterota bacterium]